jgi:EmrB/QacA subfamily drug resistance transporter
MTFSLHQRLVMVAAVITTAMMTVDLTIVTVALPEISSDLPGSGITGLQWVVISYTVTFGALLQVAGSLTDSLGLRRMFLYGIIGFTLASLACGLAPNLLFLNISRGLQGVAAAIMFANIIPLIARNFDDDLRARAIGVWSAVIGVASVIAPVFGGFLVDIAGWRSLFLINLPIGILAFVLIAKVVQPGETRDPRFSWSNFDLSGATIIVVALVALNLALAYAQGSGGWSSPATLIAFAISVVGLALFIIRERQTSTPIVDLAILRRPTFVGVSLLALINRVGTVGATVYLVILLQDGYSYSALEVGLLLIPMGAVTLVASLWAGNIQSHIEPKSVLGVGFLILAASSAVLAWQFSAHHDPRALVPATMIWGLGNALANTPIMNVTTTSVPLEKVGMATGMVNSFFPIGAGLGTAILGTTFASIAGTDPDAFSFDDLADANAVNYLVVAGLMLFASLIAFVLVGSRRRPITTPAQQSDKPDEEYTNSDRGPR